MGIIDYTGSVVARYSYDAWGKQYAVTNGAGVAQPTSNSSFIGHVNPIRYRGYYYDTETGLYYCLSRYYDPVVGRFINADSLVDNRNISTVNMFVYCANNPVMNVDPNGKSWIAIIGIIVLGLGGAAFLGGCSSNPSGSTAISESTTVPRITGTKPSTTPTTVAAPLTKDQKVLVATIAAEATVTAQGKPVSSAGRQAMANVALNRVGSREWSKYETVAEICQYTGFDGYGDRNYQACMTYLNARDGSDDTYEAIIWDVMAAYNNDITGGCQLYYTPAAMRPSGSSPKWNFSVLTEVNVPGVDTYYEGRFYKYK